MKIEKYRVCKIWGQIKVKYEKDNFRHFKMCQPDKIDFPVFSKLGDVQNINRRHVTVLYIYIDRLSAKAELEQSLVLSWNPTRPGFDNSQLF